MAVNRRRRSQTRQRASPTDTARDKGQPPSKKALQAMLGPSFVLPGPVFVPGRPTPRLGCHVLDVESPHEGQSAAKPPRARRQRTRGLPRRRYPFLARTFWTLTRFSTDRGDNNPSIVALVNPLLRKGRIKRRGSFERFASFYSDWEINWPEAGKTEFPLAHRKAWTENHRGDCAARRRTLLRVADELPGDWALLSKASESCRLNA
jgi:hypothetical protein